MRVFININKVYIFIIMKNKKKNIIFNDIFHIFKIPINFLFQDQLMRIGVSIKLILNKIKINIRDIIA